MLQYNTVSAGTLELLKKLMSLDEFANMRLAGGTSLALQVGHRVSVDLDFFGELDFSQVSMTKCFSGFESITTLKRSEQINIFEINGVKVDFVNYQYPWLEEELIVENIRLASKKDIAAMKIAAITGRGSRKDFIDLFFLLKEFSLTDIISFFEKKYFDASPMLALKSLTYFEDAESNPLTNQIEPIEWASVKERIKDEVLKFIHKLS